VAYSWQSSDSLPKEAFENVRDGIVPQPRAAVKREFHIRWGWQLVGPGIEDRHVGLDIAWYKVAIPTPARTAA
jgi:hypothetical protein